MSKDQNQSDNRAAYSPGEFAALFNRHGTWAYRLLYSGKLRAVTGLGRILIPASEVERILAPLEEYNPKPKPKPKKVNATLEGDQ